MCLSKVTSVLLTSTSRPATAYKDCLCSTKRCINPSSVFKSVKVNKTHTAHTVQTLLLWSVQEAAQQGRFAPQILQFPAAVQAQDIHLCESISGKNMTNVQSCNPFLPGEHIVCDCMFHNQKNIRAILAYSHSCCSISRQFKVTEITASTVTSKYFKVTVEQSSLEKSVKTFHF